MAPIHPDATPVLLLNREARDRWMLTLWEIARDLQRPPSGRRPADRRGRRQRRPGMTFWPAGGLLLLAALLHFLAPISRRRWRTVILYLAAAAAATGAFWLLIR